MNALPKGIEREDEGELILVSAGLLIQNDGLLWFTIPNVSHFIQMCREGAEEVRRIIARISDADTGEGGRRKRARRTVESIATAERSAAFMGVPASRLTAEATLR